MKEKEYKVFEVSTWDTDRKNTWNALSWNNFTIVKT